MFSKIKGMIKKTEQNNKQTPYSIICEVCGTRNVPKREYTAGELYGDIVAMTDARDCIFCGCQILLRHRFEKVSKN